MCPYYFPDIITFTRETRQSDSIDISGSVVVNLCCWFTMIEKSVNFTLACIDIVSIYVCVCVCVCVMQANTTFEEPLLLFARRENRGRTGTMTHAVFQRSWR